MRAAATAGQARGAVYNVGTGRQTTIRGAVEALARLLPISAQPSWGTMPGRSWDTSVWVADNTALREGLGFTPRWSLEDGLRATIGWMTETDERRKFYEDRIPIRHATA